MNTDDKKENPDINEWRKLNPEKTINDYFKIYGRDSKISNNSYSYNNYYESKVELKSKNNSKNWVYIFVSLFVLITFLSNPKNEEHKEALKNKLNSIVEDVIDEKTDNIFAIGFGKTIADLVINQLLKNVSTENYVFFSLTKINYGANSQIIGFGFLGRVYISDKIDKKIINYLIDDRLK